MKSDLQRIEREELPALAANPEPAAIVAFFRDTMFPIFGQVIEEIEEIDEAVEDLGADAEDILQPESAEAFGVVIVTGQVVVSELKKRLSATEDARLLKVCLEFEEQLKKASQVLEDVFVPQTEEDPEDPEEPEDKAKEKEKPGGGA